MKPVLFALLLSSLSFAADFVPKYGPVEKPYATPLRQDHAFMATHLAPDYWILAPYYAGMQGGHSASAASVTMVINALRKDFKYSSADELVTEAALLKAIPAAKWADKLAGQKPAGVNLAELAALTDEALNAYGLKKYRVKAVAIADAEKKSIEAVRKILVDNEKSDANFVVANYLQSRFTNDPEGAVGTYSPVAAFDAAGERVLLFETDRKYYEPIWVSLQAFVEGAAQLKDAAGKPAGGMLWLTK